MQLLDPVLALAAGAVLLLVEWLRRVAQIRHDEARVVLGLLAREHFRLDDDAAGLVPGVGLVRRLAEELSRLAGLRDRAPRLREERLRVLEDPLVPLMATTYSTPSSSRSSN